MNILLKFVKSLVIILFVTTTIAHSEISKEEKIIECNYFLNKMQIEEAWSYKKFNDRVTAHSIFPLYGGTLYGFVAYSVSSCFIQNPATLFITALAGLYGFYNCNKAKSEARKTLDNFKQKKEKLLKEKEIAIKALKEQA